MRFRPANISLINRRYHLPRLPLTLSSSEKGDQRTLTGHYISLLYRGPLGSDSATTTQPGEVWETFYDCASSYVMSQSRVERQQKPPQPVVWWHIALGFAPF